MKWNCLDLNPARPSLTQIAVWDCIRQTDIHNSLNKDAWGLHEVVRNTSLNILNNELHLSRHLPLIYFTMFSQGQTTELDKIEPLNWWQKRMPLLETGALTYVWVGNTNQRLSLVFRSVECVFGSCMWYSLMVFAVGVKWIFVCWIFVENQNIYQLDCGKTVSASTFGQNKLIVLKTERFSKFYLYLLTLMN